MTVHYVIELRCDHDGCTHGIRVRGNRAETPAKARAVAAEHEWTTNETFGGLGCDDLCPDHRVPVPESPHRVPV